MRVKNRIIKGLVCVIVSVSIVSTQVPIAIAGSVTTQQLQAARSEVAKLKTQVSRYERLKLQRMKDFNKFYDKYEKWLNPMKTAKGVVTQASQTIMGQVVGTTATWAGLGSIAPVMSWAGLVPSLGIIGMQLHAYSIATDAYRWAGLEIIAKTKLILAKIRLARMQRAIRAQTRPSPSTTPTAVSSSGINWWLWIGLGAVGLVAAAASDNSSSGGGGGGSSGSGGGGGGSSSGSSGSSGSGGLSDVTVSQRNITLRMWDHGRIDGDQIDLIVNGTYLLTNHVLVAPPGTTVNATLNSGNNTIIVHADNVGTWGGFPCPPNTASLEISHVTSGDPTQEWSVGLNENASLVISAP